MPNFRRSHQPGGTFFLTLVTHDRQPLLENPVARQILRAAIDLTRRDRAFEVVAMVLLLDHLHLILTLPADDADFSTRVAVLKSQFTRDWLAAGGDEAGQTLSRDRQGYRGVWQKRFWEHTVRDEADLIRCVEYVHYNPVKHGLATCPHAWEWSTFHRFVREGTYDADWSCACQGRVPGRSPADVRGAEMD